jgi:hypothetical protein
VQGHSRRWKNNKILFSETVVIFLKSISEFTRGGSNLVVKVQSGGWSILLFLSVFICSYLFVDPVFEKNMQEADLMDPGSWHLGVRKFGVSVWQRIAIRAHFLDRILQLRFSMDDLDVVEKICQTMVSAV